MNPDREIELKEALSTLAQRYNISGHLFLYLDETKVRFVGDMSLAALMPFMVKAVSDKLTK